jgi:hypothetical protein
MVGIGGTPLPVTTAMLTELISDVLGLETTTVTGRSISSHSNTLRLNQSIMVIHQSRKIFEIDATTQRNVAARALKSEPNICEFSIESGSFAVADTVPSP